ncbi:MAG: hypothetical protein KAJ92_06765 [Gammaproteobacteria bacterium]|nr:hypothetical protein [Gammaproteobacteria bacterium]MCK5263371.1 hypothetical protein [Gammaproteobacteria bacterium]
MATKKEDAANSEKNASVDDAKTKKSTKKLETEAVMDSGEKPAGVGPNRLMTLIMAMIVAIPTAAIVAYIAIPQQLNNPISLSNDAGNKGSNNFYAHQQIPASPSAAGVNSAQETEWLEQRRAEMEKRRSEFEKYNTDYAAANRSSSEPPQWVKDRQAKMEQRRAEFEKQSAVNRNPSEPPQWVKDQQALMQQEQEKYQQEWAKRSADMSYNRAPNQPGYMANPGMNPYQSNQAPAYPQNPGSYYNGIAQPVNPPYYNNAPYSGPHNVPYGQYGYPYR